MTATTVFLTDQGFVECPRWHAGQLLRKEADGQARGAFACVLGGLERRTLLITAANWFGMEGMAEMAGTGQLLTVPVSVPGAGWP
jgi:sugar lactone lactonase YvrE